jgi:hypothetical protein
MSNKKRPGNVYDTISYMDLASANYGFSQNYGLTPLLQNLPPGSIVIPNQQAPNQQLPMANRFVQGLPADMMPQPANQMVRNPQAPAYVLPSGQYVQPQQNMPAGQPTNYSVNPAIQNKTYGTDTFRVSITVNKTGTGSGNTYNPVFLFGGNAFTNASKGYTAVQNAGQVTSLVFANGKNAINFRYATDGANYTDYTVSLTTEGEYPFVINSLSNRKYMVQGFQSQISDVSELSQLDLPMSSFYLNEFGKADTNDLTTPIDLYQQRDNGIFYPHQFPISGIEGLVTNILDVDNFVVNYYFFCNKIKGGCGC